MGSLALAAPGLLLLAAGPTLAGVVFLARPDRAQNRRLAALLLVTSLSLGFYSGVRVAADERATAYAAYAVFAPLLFLMPILYIRFLATLETPLRRALASRITQGIVVAVTLVAYALWYTRRERFLLGMVDGGFWRFEQGPLNTIFVDGVSAALMLLGLTVAALAWWRSPTPLARRQNRIYALAFGIRDAIIVLWVGVFTDLVVAGRAPLFLIMLLPLAELLLVGLLAYGMLKMQLFDIDLRIKWTLSKGTVAAAFVAVFFIVSEGAQQLLSKQLGSLAGLVAAGSLVFALAPLQRAADRLVDGALPTVRDSPEYLTVRRREVYQAAVEGVLEDGEITPKERSVLARLQDQLGLTASEALTIEREAMRARAA